MKVGELLEKLQGMDEEADIFIMFQESYPFEAYVRGICTRQAMAESPYNDDFDPDEIEEVDPETEAKRRENAQRNWGDQRWQANEWDLPRDDVFIVMGDQARYGNKLAWEVS